MTVMMAMIIIMMIILILISIPIVVIVVAVMMIDDGDINNMNHNDSNLKNSIVTIRCNLTPLQSFPLFFFLIFSNSMGFVISFRIYSKLKPTCHQSSSQYPQYNFRLGMLTLRAGNHGFRPQNPNLYVCVLPLSIPIHVFSVSLLSKWNKLFVNSVLIYSFIFRRYLRCDGLPQCRGTV